MRKKRLFFNTLSSLGFQLCTIICGFILPRLILSEYGSEVNGLVNSITQFLAIVGFLELGVGAVVQSALYKPLSDNDAGDISRIIASANRFFSRLGYILLIYVIILIFVYPKMANLNFGWIYSATLIVAMSISSFAQYFFGIVDRLLLVSDQRGYVQYTIQIIALITNTILCVILIKLGSSIQLVKLVTSIVFLLVPICIRIYVNNNYSILPSRIGVGLLSSPKSRQETIESFYYKYLEALKSLIHFEIKSKDSVFHEISSLPSISRTPPLSIMA